MDEGEDSEEQGEVNLASIVANARASAAENVGRVRRAYPGILAAMALSVGVSRSQFTAGAPIEWLPMPLASAILAAGFSLQILALAKCFSASRKPLPNVDPDEPFGGRPSYSDAHQLAAYRFSSYTLHNLNCSLEQFYQTCAVVVACILAQVSGRPWALANFAAVMLLILAHVPTLGRMERWVARRVASRLEMAPPLDLAG